MEKFTQIQKEQECGNGLLCTQHQASTIIMATCMNTYGPTYTESKNIKQNIKNGRDVRIMVGDFNITFSIFDSHKGQNK